MIVELCALPKEDKQLPEYHLVLHGRRLHHIEFPVDEFAPDVIVEGIVVLDGIFPVFLCICQVLWSRLPETAL